MLDMRAVVKCRQIPNQADASDWSPTNIFNQTVVGCGSGRNHHRSAGELGVIEGQKQAWAPVDVLICIRSQGKWATPETRKTEEDCCLITDLSPVAEPARAQRGNVRRKTNAQNIDVMQHAILVTQTENVT